MNIKFHKFLFWTLFVLCSLIFILPSVLADTGTYEITKQYADLIVNTDGTVTISYDVDFTVTGGNIPWVTLGIPNRDFDILDSGGAVASVKKQNSGGWTGVYIDLNKKYLPGETFNFKVKTLQRGLILKKDENQASLVFTPVWWDNAITKDLKVTMQPPPVVNEVKTTVQATSMEGNKVIWQWSDVGRGVKHNVGILMPAEPFKSISEPSQGTVGSAPSNNGLLAGTILGIPIIVIITGVIIYFVFIRSGGRSRSYESPSISLGGDDEITRHINMDCPNGHGRLDKRDIQGVTIDYCDKCGGAQFDKGEIESLIKKEVNESEFDTRKGIIFLKDIKDGNIKCPRCDGQMYKKTKDVEGKDVIIFVCEECEGLWINRGNYQIIKDKRIEQEELQKKRKDESDDEDDDSWIYPATWWIFASNIGATGSGSSASFGGGSFGGGGSSDSSSSSYSGCVSCNCVASCACACACAIGSGLGCAPKDKLLSKGIKMEDLYPEKRKI